MIEKDSDILCYLTVKNVKKLIIENLNINSILSRKTFSTALLEKCPNTELFFVLIFPHSDKK